MVKGRSTGNNARDLTVSPGHCEALRGEPVLCFKRFDQRDTVVGLDGKLPATAIAQGQQTS